MEAGFCLPTQAAYEIQWNSEVMKEHCGKNARTGKETYKSFEDLLKNVPRACGGLEMGLAGNGVLTPQIQDCDVRSDEDINFWRRFGLKEIPLYAKDKHSLIYQDIRAGDIRSVEIGRVKIS